MQQASVELVIEYEGEAGGRVGRLRTPHGEIPTPTFMPCASWGTVRACTPTDVVSVGLGIMVCNAFHLSQRPGAERIAACGGLHRFIGWDGPLATDSGGFQVLSLSSGESISEDGVLIRSAVDGQLVMLTPEAAVSAQEKIGADISVALDICPPYPISQEEARGAVERTLRWAERCLAAHSRPDQSLWGVVQGGVFPELRRRSAQATAALGFEGFCIGGLSVGESRGEMLSALSAALAALPKEPPRWLMGVGTPRDIVECAMLGVDLFDCVLPTRMARHGSIVTSRGVVKIGNARWGEVWEAVDPSCDCPMCTRYSAAYVHHLFRIGEAAAWRLLSLHNLRYYARLMTELRHAMQAGEAQELLRALPQWTIRDTEEPSGLA
ncbi:MAG: tRNA guanosine(34) transglycosylase Tgt [Armatimonadetes bacterium]|nr:tRNA guanosine(34) transglycosylase Tgt [Armatimonadota bacterium]